ncbi:AAA family ATPase [Giesbergeria anulus]|uniref:Exonuclease SbcC n=1 Tax=Giesbergeria anulus TaxID=180197 RepID=A0A1H9NL14_9BURK|nr:AAA family ATPase [Giesbergeria anulus]SER36626.1 exonuclease SbcC [Giesbergeria anulus]
MKPKKLKLKGFKGIASGRGKSEVEIDFTGINPEAKIVALAGPNGVGKSTIIDNMHPFRVMPSRSSRAVPSAFSYKDQVIMGDSGKEFEWSHDGIDYRTVFSFRQTPKTFKQDCFLFVVGADGQAKPWSDPATGLTSDGKAENYDQCVEAILGKPEVFFTAQFSAQGKQPIGRMTAGEVKTLLGQMLGMEQTVALGAKANSVTKELKPHLNAAQEVIARLLRDRPNLEQLQQEYQQQQAQLERLYDQQDKASKQRDKALEHLSVVKQQVAQQEGILAQHQQVQQQLDGATEAAQSKQQALAHRHSQEKAMLDSQVHQTASAVNVARQRASDLRKQIDTQGALVAQAPALNAEREKLVLLDDKRKAQVAIIERNEPAVFKLNSIREELMGLKQALAKAETDGRHIADVLNKAKATASLLGEVPCHGTAMAGCCKLLAESNHAAQKIPADEVKYTRARSQYKDIFLKTASREQEIATMVEAEGQIKQAKQALVEIDAAISTCNSALARQPFVDAAVEQLPLLQQQAQQAQSELDGAQQAQAQVAAQLSQLEQRQTAEREELNQECQREVARLQAAKASLPAISNSNDAQAAQQALDDANRLEQSIAAQLQGLNKAMLDTQTKMSRAQDIDFQLAQAQERVNQISEEISKWLLLTKALGTDGIVAMQIDDAGPAIAGITNTLLQDCYGGRFQITLVTQAQTATGITKEALLIQVEDTHRGEIKLLDDMSGGEKVWINECLVRGIALYIAQAADVQYETLFSDESDGALDPERKRQYMEMQRAVVERGGYSREYIITQTPELLNLCDAVIDVSIL